MSRTVPAPLASRRRRALLLVGWLAVGVFLVAALVWFATQVHIASRGPISIAGEVITACVLAGWIVTSAGLRRDRDAGRSPLLAERARAVIAGELAEASAVQVRAVDDPPILVAAARTAAARALEQLDRCSADADLPPVLLVRAHKHGVEFLLAGSLEEAPPHTELLESGNGLRLVAESQASSSGFDGHYELIEVGVDGESIYFAPASSALTADSGASKGRAPAVASLAVVADGGEIVVEPFGLRLVPIPTVTADSHVEGDRSPASPGPGELWDHFGDEPVESLADSDGEAVTANDAGDDSDEWLVPPGPIEVRILREEPDLVGDLVADPDRQAIEFVAFLSLHGYKAPTSRLRDALGTARSNRSRSVNTVWAAAGAARRCLGEDRVPPASGNQPYSLSPEVSCDWGRFEDLVQLARTNAADPDLAARALTQALALVEGVPAAASQRFSWLDTEHLLIDISTAVVEAACELAELELASLASTEQASERVTWAIKKGRLLEPRSTVLAELERRLQRS